MSIIENDYAAYIHTADGEVPLRDLDAQEKIGSLSEDILKIAENKIGKNKIDFHNPLYVGKYVNQLNGEIIDNSAINVTDFVALELGKDYTISSDKYCSVIFCNSNEITKNIAGTFDKVDMDSSYSISGAEALEGYTFTANTPYLIMWYPNSATYIQVEEGDIKTEYEEYFEYVELKKGIYLNGEILLEMINENNANMVVFEQAYLKNQRLVAENNYIGEGAASGVVAKYTCVEMGENVRSVECECVFNGNFGSVALVLGNVKYMKPADVSKGAIHIVFQPSNGTKGQCYASYFKEGSNTIIETKSFEPCLVDGKTKYKFGVVLENNTLTINMPDGTTATYENHIFQEIVGKYAFWEHYTTNVEADVNTNAEFTKFYATGINGAVLMDEFNRNDGAIGNAPTGQVYWQFRNGVSYEI